MEISVFLDSWNYLPKDATLHVVNQYVTFIVPSRNEFNTVLKSHFKEACVPIVHDKEHHHHHHHNHFPEGLGVFPVP